MACDLAGARSIREVFGYAFAPPGLAAGRNRTDGAGSSGAAVPAAKRRTRPTARTGGRRRPPTARALVRAPD